MYNYSLLNLQSLPVRVYAAMNVGEGLYENEEFHESFDFPQATRPPGTSHRNPASQSFTSLASNIGQTRIAELSATVAQAEAENDEKERRAEVASGTPFYRIKPLESIEAVPAGHPVAQELSLTTKDLRADLALPARVPTKSIVLGCLQGTLNMRVGRLTRRVPEVRN